MFNFGANDGRALERKYALDQHFAAYANGTDIKHFVFSIPIFDNIATA